MTALNRKRWEKFKSHKRGYISLWLFGILLIGSFFAEFIANDKPLLVKYEGKYLFPIFTQYSETHFGGDFQTEANYKDSFVQELILQNNANYIIFAPIPYSYNTIIYDLGAPSPTAPNSKNLLGTDDQARDVFARIIYGFRISILFGLALTLSSCIIGIIVGGVSGYYGGWVDLGFQRLIEIFAGLPVLFLLIILTNFIEPNFWWLLLIMLLFSWLGIVNLVRAEFLRTRNFEYVLSAKALGQSDHNIIFKHILPNALVATITFLPFILNSSIATLTSLDFLGFGLPPESPSLGELLAQGKRNLHAPWLGITGFFVICIMLSLITFVGEGLRDALDSRSEIKC